MFKKKLKPDSNGFSVTSSHADLHQVPERRLGLQLLGNLGNKLSSKVKVNGSVVRDSRKMSSDGLQVIRRQDISVPSTTALILQDRPT